MSLLKRIAHICVFADGFNAKPLVHKTKEHNVPLNVLGPGTHTQHYGRTSLEDKRSWDQIFSVLHIQ